jgi:hypothetical protein
MDSGAQDRVEAEGGKLRDIYDRAWAEAALASTSAALKAALPTAQPLTHLKVGRAKVEKIASNRRIMGDDGRVKAVRWTTTRDAAVRAEPEGVIDPDIKTISLWNGEVKLAVLHYYAVHPSSYEDLWVSPDFVGLARDRRAQEDGRVPHLYFTECAGDITAGKYNDGDRRNRELFAQRMLLAMQESERETRTVPADKVEWRSIPLNLPPRDDTTIAQLQQRIADTTRTHKDRQRDAMELSYAERWHRPIMINALHIDDSVCIVQLPGEPFIAYQLLAQRLRPDAFVAVPAYGDCSPGYICVDGSFEEGGYEPVDAFVTAAAEPLMTEAITRAVARA